MQPPAISIDHLTVRYGPTTALDDARLAIADGEVHALLGENGAGKSTIVKVLSGLMRPNTGSVLIFGRSLARFEPGFANRTRGPDGVPGNIIGKGPHGRAELPSHGGAAQCARYGARAGA